MPDVSEAPHLVQLIEKQPSCLMRVGRDGILLACNDSGLNLLGKSELVQVLERNFDEHVASDHLAAWTEFVERVWTAGAGSLECELFVSDVKRLVLLQAVALRNHPDGLESLLMA